MWFSKLKEGEDCCDVPRDLMVNIENTGRQDKVLHLTRGGLARKSGYLRLNLGGFAKEVSGRCLIDLRPRSQEAKTTGKSVG